MSTIYTSNTNNQKEFVTKILKIFKHQIDKANTIFVKPNIVSLEPYPTTTHPETLDTLLDFLSHKELIVGDGHAVDTGFTKSIIENSPLKQVCNKYNIELTNLYEKQMEKHTSHRGYTIKSSTLPNQCDYVISLPVLKAHKQCGLSGALKNQFGYLSKLDRILMHSKIKDIHKGIAEVNVANKTDLFIVDAVEVLTKAQECRHGGCKGKLNIMIAGTDPVAIDYYGNKLLQKIDPTQSEEVKHIDYAQEYGVGKKEYKINKI
ncbi:hypothetical protein AC477_02920 [miscellaneous Crenarchaeota group-1 archaeon SG8-32-1]|uniref:DUF362 domain-containing protein n=1 Tax=miscellaneous Crenarchaeota group-1 archaeon SG8-32-1 TaxID=1685124 RepID=A0A0M0BWF8_9ARCH|nr:MAG: hypothetical protein AC477_02920 [miscellaneous Crenarchaeota group-1 archaeon SG8-32-1]